MSNNFALALAKFTGFLKTTLVCFYDDNTIRVRTIGEYGCDQYIDIKTGNVSGPNGKNWTNVYDF